MKKAIGYIRVSTEQQSGPDTYGVEAQRNAIQSYAKANGYELVDIKEDHVSGKSDDRPMFNEILTKAFNPPIQAVIVFKNDRLARDMELYFYYKFCLRRKRIELVSTMEDYGAYGRFAPIIESITSFIADMERDNIAMRTRGGRRVKADKGQYSGGQAPFGYKASHGELVIDPDEADTVRMIFSLHDSGMNMADIARRLASLSRNTRRGGEFRISTIRSIIGNRKMYEGWYRYGTDGEWVRGAHQPILDPKEP